MPNQPHPLKILYLAAEVVPFAKTGGLADVAGSLPKVIKAIGHDIRIALPRYGRVSIEKFGLKPVLGPFDVPMDNQFDPAMLLQGHIDDVPVYFIDNARYFDRENIYMYPDDAERFIFYCRAAVEMCRQLNWQPDVIHCNDWHTAIIPNWLKTIYAEDPFFIDTATVYTIHNLQYQGIFGYRVLEVAGIDEYGFIYHPETADINEVVDFMARGILFADVINAVSPRYAQEIMSPEFGERLDPILRERKERVFGILNGIDHEVMNPETDPYIAAHFNRDSLDRRTENKLALQAEANLPPDPKIPLLGIISRLADQKGFDILTAAIDPILNLNLQFVLLGTGDQHYHQLFTKLAQNHPGKLSVFLTFNAALAQKIYAGTDMFLMPSRFEPCGLGQMISMRYGSIPIVRRTGGLADTVQDFDPRTELGTGFVFDTYDRWGLFTAIVRALEHYKNPDRWRKIQVQAMSQDFSWEASARQYIDLYHKALAFERQEADVPVPNPLQSTWTARP